ncbi:MAG: 16S rRNA methyltransferase [Thermoprotei archaeon]|nr:MAG: 16S rRNA methyltransferase [Thermoprotei archaeon]
MKLEKLILVLAESGLETVPKEISHHPAVVSCARRRGKKPTQILLDISLHYHAMKRLPEFQKRGRPDIAHFFLLLALDSPLNRRRLMETVIHTLQDKVIFVDPSTRIPKNYNRFVGLIEQLFEEGRVPPDSETSLLRIEEKSLRDLIEYFNPSRVFLLSERGKGTRLLEFADTIAAEKKPMLLIGGFQRGDFSEETLSLCDEIISLYDESLTSWSTVAIVLTGLSIALRLL